MTPFIESVEYLVQLHRLNMLDKNDSKEADLIRDKMDAPYQKLNRSQVDLITALSIELYKESDQGDIK